jgi:hypothetical protein
MSFGLSKEGFGAEYVGDLRLTIQIQVNSPPLVDRWQIVFCSLQSMLTMKALYGPGEEMEMWEATRLVSQQVSGVYSCCLKSLVEMLH